MLVENYSRGSDIDTQNYSQALSPTCENEGVRAFKIFIRAKVIEKRDLRKDIRRNMYFI